MRSTLSDMVTYLNEHLSVHAAVEAPTERTDRYVIVMPVGGEPSFDALNHDYALQAWATTYADAEALIREVCDVMRDNGAVTMLASPIPLGYDGIYYWWQASFTIHALW